MPLDWSELTARLDPGKFTMDVSDVELRDRARIWADGTAKPNSLKGILA
jgi:hypothetical protein